MCTAAGMQQRQVQEDWIRVGPGDENIGYLVCSSSNAEA